MRTKRQFTVYVHSDERAQLYRDAAAAGLNLSDYARTRLGLAPRSAQSSQSDECDDTEEDAE